MVTGRKLYRLREDKMVAGALSGLGKYWNVDASIMRIVYAVLTLLTGVIPGIILYALMVIIIPVEPEEGSS